MRPRFRYRLVSRRAGSFGASAVGRAMEWLTMSWIRFEIALAWVAVLLSLFVGSSGAPAELTFGLLASPIIAVVVWVILKGIGFVARQLPILGPIWGWFQIAFYWLFSRLIVQPAPEIMLPAWYR